MKRYLLAFEYKNNKPVKLIMGNFPWDGLYTVNIEDSLEYKDSIENLGITDNFDLVGYSGELSRYTTIDFNSNTCTKKSLVAIAESENYHGKVYFITDGLSDPMWISIPDLESYIQKKGYRLANVVLDTTQDGIGILKPIKGELSFVNFKEYQLEYRNYLKKIKEKTEE